MDASADGKLARRIASKTEQLGQLVARRLLREQREAMKERARQRRADLERRKELGGAVLAAGLDDWSVSEVVGLLLEGQDHLGYSPTMRLGVRKRGEAYLRVGPDSATPN